MLVDQFDSGFRTTRRHFTPIYRLLFQVNLYFPSKGIYNREARQIALNHLWKNEWFFVDKILFSFGTVRYTIYP